jgi:hypothetical protein
MIKLCLDTVGYMSKPIGIQPAQISGRIGSCSTEITISEFASAVTNGQSFATAVAFKNNKRKASNWLGSQVFAADIDTTTINNIDELLQLALKQAPPSIIYESFSSCEAQRKFRVVYITKNIQTNPTLALGFLRKITKYFNADSACVDLSRMFFGTNKQNTYVDEDAYVSDEEFVKHQLVKEVAAKRITEQADELESLDQHLLVELKLFLNKEINNLLTKANGSRYQTLFQGTLGLIRLGFISASFAEYIMTTVISENEELTSLYIDDYDKDYRDIIAEAAEWSQT